MGSLRSGPLRSACFAPLASLRLLRSLPSGTVEIHESVFMLKSRFMGTNAILVVSRNTPHVYFSSFISYIRFMSLNFDLHTIFITSYNLFTDSSLVENCFIICRGVYIDHCLHQFFFRNVELSRVTLSV